MRTLLLLLSLTFGDAARLGADDYGDRQAAECRLAWAGELALPAVVVASRDRRCPERRRRAERLLGALEGRHRPWAHWALALWLFYGPDEYASPTPSFRRFLGDGNSQWVRHLPDETQADLVWWSGRWGLRRGSEYDPNLFDGYVNVMRFRARGLPDPR